MRATLIGLIAGSLFGAGLVVSGMANPHIVLGFLTLGPGWNPALAFVMAGALAVTVPGFAWARRHPQIGARIPAFAAAHVDPRLVWGAALFGLGWGFAGYCPGPAIVSAGLLQGAAFVFLPAMLLGGWVVDRWQDGVG